MNDITPSPGQIEQYRETFRRRCEEERRNLDERRERAWILAKHAASILREKYHVTNVVVFGSLIRPEMFTKRSDVDIAAWGIEPKDTFRAIVDVLYLDKEIEINLADIETCTPSLRETIEEQRIEL